MSTGKLLRTFDHGGALFPDVPVAFTPDGNVLAFGSGYGRIHLWEVSTGRELKPPGFEDDVSGVTALTFSPCGKMLGSV